MSFEDFSLPEMVISQDGHDLDFKFCSVMEPGVSPDSPADHLFSNGRLVPHDFPCSFSKVPLSPVSRSTSYGSSKDGSEFSSSSRSSSCSSSQSSSSSSSSSTTSTSDAFSERRVLIRARGPRSTSAIKRAPEANKVHNHVSTTEHGSRKWQFIAAAPVLNGNVLRKAGKVKENNRAKFADQKVSKARKEGKSNGCWRRFLCLFVAACNEFHAIESSAIEC